MMHACFDIPASALDIDCALRLCIIVQATGVHACSMTGWMQVDSGLWTLNGRTVGRIARFYCFPAWACLGLDNDIPLLQIWAATSSKPYECVHSRCATQQRSHTAP